MVNHEMLVASAIWGLLGATLFLLWCIFGFFVRQIGLFSTIIESRRSQILRAFRWVWMLPLSIAFTMLVLAMIWD